ncbi:hypothetical protein [Maribellus sp. YY47]|uniref:hypothetical protein n=1 Tax=Maribellus sp. YY47 TaxID=2929486 RepID=UPI002000653D|nr:hypothetical protein [Maribellus sp. YY47]MCK3682858.1 hypothetical protein [Maribellus sp. YY47]
MKQLIWIITALIVGFPLGSEAQETIHLFPDRSSCVSGDTVWFYAVVSNNGSENSGNIIHIQLDDLTQNHITKVSVASDNNCSSGYLVVPDSLSTGIYTLTAFANIQKKETSSIFYPRYLVVYNRFDNNISEFNIPVSEFKEAKSEPGISITANQPSNNSRTVDVKVDTDNNLCPDALEMIVTARLLDPFADHFSGEIEAGFETANQEPFMPVRENNGILITGRVVQKETEHPVQNTPVLLSIADTFPYFDYCVSDAGGRFYFYIRNAVGKGNIVLQEVSEHANENRIELLENYIETQKAPVTHQILTLQQNTFASDLVKAAYFNRIFKGFRAFETDSFSIKREFTHPFYGPPTFTFYPELFIDLPDFSEISREILHGVQYREKNDEVTIRLFNNGNKSIFKNEPLKLLDGIPIFNPKLLSKLKTQDIDKIDAVYFKRYFGDISFDGVLSVYTKNRTLGWVESVPGLNVFKYTFIQPPLSQETNKSIQKSPNSPDFRTVFYRNRWTETSNSKSFSVDLSDIKGDMLIEVIVVCKDKRIVQNRKVIHLD